MTVYIVEVDFKVDLHRITAQNVFLCSSNDAAVADPKLSCFMAGDVLNIPQISIN